MRHYVPSVQALHNKSVGVPRLNSIPAQRSRRQQRKNRIEFLNNLKLAFRAFNKAMLSFCSGFTIPTPPTPIPSDSQTRITAFCHYWRFRFLELPSCSDHYRTSSQSDNFPEICTKQTRPKTNMDIVTVVLLSVRRKTRFQGIQPTRSPAWAGG